MAMVIENNWLVFIENGNVLDYQDTLPFQQNMTEKDIKNQLIKYLYFPENIVIMPCC